MRKTAVKTTILNFRHFIERHKSGQRLFYIVQIHLKEQGLLLQEGSIVDASIIQALGSTKNKEGKRDPEMHQVRKDKQWYFGMKMHIAVDESPGLVHSISTTPANCHDITQVGPLLHGREKRVWGDAGYLGSEKREEHRHRKVDWLIAQRPGKRAAMAGTSETAQTETVKASVRAKVEHVFHRIKQQFGYSKVRYRGLAKNTNRLYLLAGFTNLLRSEKYLVC